MSEKQNSYQPTVDVPQERAEKLLRGELTLGQFAGLTSEKLYEYAEAGYRLLQQGKLDEAKQIYSGLVAANPYDSVFHCHLATAHHHLGESDEALHHYTEALRFNIASVDALAGRGELYLTRGEFAPALADIKRAIELDPKATRPSSIRARAVLRSLKEAADKYQATAVAAAPNDLADDH